MRLEEHWLLMSYICFYFIYSGKNTSVSFRMDGSCRRYIRRIVSLSCEVGRLIETSVATLRVCYLVIAVAHYSMHLMTSLPLEVTDRSNEGRRPNHNLYSRHQQYDYVFFRLDKQFIKRKNMFMLT